MTHNESITTFSQLSHFLSMKKEQQDSELMQLLMWLSLVSAKLQGSRQET